MFSARTARDRHLRLGLGAVRPSLTLVLVMIGVAACSAGSESVDGASRVPTSAISAPPVVPEPTTPEVSIPPTAPPSVVDTPPTPVPSSLPALVELGIWDWGAPCRVTVEQRIAGSGPLVTRSFDVVVTRLDDGFRLDAENVVIEAGSMTDAELAGHLLERGALLPSVVLDRTGGFVQFADLDELITETAATAGLEVQEPIPVSNSTITYVRHATIGSWFDAWSDAEVLSPQPIERTVDGSFLDIEDAATLRIGGEMLTSAGPLDPPHVAAVFRYEFGDDLRIGESPTPRVDIEVPDGDPWYYRAGLSTDDGEAGPDSDTVRIVARLSAQLDADRRRPLASLAEYVVTLTTDESDRTIFGFRITSDFDWASAAGCA